MTVEDMVPVLGRLPYGDLTHCWVPCTSFMKTPLHDLPSVVPACLRSYPSLVKWRVEEGCLYEDYQSYSHTMGPDSLVESIS